MGVLEAHIARVGVTVNALAVLTILWRSSGAGFGEPEARGALAAAAEALARHPRSAGAALNAFLLLSFLDAAWCGSQNVQKRAQPCLVYRARCFFAIFMRALPRARVRKILVNLPQVCGLPRYGTGPRQSADPLRNIRGAPPPRLRRPPRGDGPRCSRQRDECALARGGGRAAEGRGGGGGAAGARDCARGVRAQAGDPAQGARCGPLFASCYLTISHDIIALYVSVVSADSVARPISFLCTDATVHLATRCRPTTSTFVCKAAGQANLVAAVAGTVASTLRPGAPLGSFEVAEAALQALQTLVELDASEGEANRAQVARALGGARAAARAVVGAAAACRRVDLMFSLPLELLFPAAVRAAAAAGVAAAAARGAAAGIARLGRSGAPWPAVWGAAAASALLVVLLCLRLRWLCGAKGVLLYAGALVALLAAVVSMWLANSGAAGAWVERAWPSAVTDRAGAGAGASAWEPAGVSGGGGAGKGGVRSIPLATVGGGRSSSEQQRARFAPVPPKGRPPPAEAKSTFTAAEGGGAGAAGAAAKRTGGGSIGGGGGFRT